MKEWRMIIDVARCEDCNNCMLACRDEHVENDWPGYSAPQPRLGQRWMSVERRERGQFPLIDVAYRPTPCQQCAEPACAAVGGAAVVRRADGVVLINPEKAKGKREMVEACPYGAIFWNEELETAQKCTFCAHLLDDGWRRPRCVQACPTGALEVLQLEPESWRQFAEERKLAPLYPEFRTAPRALYANLERFERCFIAGGVAESVNGVIDCAVGLSVRLECGDTVVAECVTDAFGDFKFDGLQKGSGGYTVSIVNRKGEGKTIAVEWLEKSLSLGEVRL
jgi:Fe-S-cluster-containing dehydrogenase component